MPRASRVALGGVVCAPGPLFHPYQSKSLAAASALIRALERPSMHEEHEDDLEDDAAATGETPDESAADAPVEAPRRKKKKPPLVAICGRPNVGKSTLFNRITGRQHAIVHSDEGITRDRAYGRAEWNGRIFRLVDTGGVVENPMDPVTQKMQEHVRAALKEAKVVLFVVDGQVSPTRIDDDIRDELFRLGKPVVLCVNKLDNPRLAQNRTEFYAMGLGEPVGISSTHNLGTDDLMDAIMAHLPDAPLAEEAAADEAPRPVTKVAIVGKPNVGKSSFINALFNEDRVIVTDIPGTTRDAIDNEFHYNGKDYLFIDTAGMRRKGNIRYEVERYSVNRSLRAVNRADVCLVVMDATEGITEQDKRIVHYIVEQGAAMILVWSKWDLVEDREAAFKRIDDQIDRQAPFLKYVPYITISNVTRLRVFKTLEFIDRVAESGQRRIGTGELNRFMKDIRLQVPAAMHKGRQAKILYATQAGIKPTTFVLFVNQPGLFHFSYLRFLENRLREKFGFEGVPIKIELRAGDKKKEDRR